MVMKFEIAIYVSDIEINKLKNIFIFKFVYRNLPIIKFEIKWTHYLHSIVTDESVNQRVGFFYCNAR